MLDVWINEIINKYINLDIKKEDGLKNSDWMNIQLLTVIVFLSLPENVCMEYKDQDILDDILDILKKDFVGERGKPYSYDVRIEGYWPPEKQTEIGLIYVKCLYVYLHKMLNTDIGIFAERMFYYPFLGKLKVVKYHNYEKARDSLRAFFDGETGGLFLSERNMNIGDQRENLLRKYAINLNQNGALEKCDLDKYYHIGFTYENGRGRGNE